MTQPTLEPTKINEDLFQYVLSSVLVNKSAIKETTLLFKEGFFDSMAFVLLLDYLEEHFGIKPNDEDLIEENFESIEAMTRFILCKKNQPSN